MLKCYAGFPGPSSAISEQFTLKICVTAGNKKKFTKNPYFGSSRSFKDIVVDTNKRLSILLVMISSMSLPICSHFHTTRELR